MTSLSARARNILMRVLILCAVCVGLSACAGSDDPSSSISAATEYASYRVVVNVGGKDQVVNVQVSSAMSEYYLDTNNHELDKSAVETLAGDRIRRAVDEGMMALPVGADAEMTLFIGHEEKLVDTPLLQPEGCMMYLGTSTTSYFTNPIYDAYGCRYYKFTDVYDVFYNTCSGTQQQYYVTTTYEEYRC